MSGYTYPYMEPDTTLRLDTLEKKVDLIYISVEKTRKYFFWTMIVTLVLLVVPLIGLAFAVPSFLNTYTTTVNTIAP
jgi:type IV secretory pathway component VirB8